MTNIYDALRRSERQPPSAAIPQAAGTDTPRPNVPPAAPPPWRGSAINLLPCVKLPTELMIGLRRKIQASIGEQSSPVVVIASARKGEGTTTVSQNLALTLCEDGAARVLLINPNVDAPTPAQPDLSHVVAETGGSDAGIIASSHPGLAFAWLHGAPPDGRAVDLHGVFATLRTMFDFIIIDAGSVDRWVNEQVLCKPADSLLLVVQAERIRWPVVEQTLETLETMGARVSGIVLNQRPSYVPKSLARFQ